MRAWPVGLARRPAKTGRGGLSIPAQPTRITRPATLSNPRAKFTTGRASPRTRFFVFFKKIALPL